MWTDARADLFRIDKAGGLRRHLGDFHASVRDSLGRLEDGGVLDGGGDEVIAGAEEPKEGCVVAFRAAGIENDFSVVTVEELGEDLAGFVDAFSGVLSVQMNRGGVAEVLHPVGIHRLHHFRTGAVWWHWHPCRPGLRGSVGGLHGLRLARLQEDG